jgi:hypothetical protein
VITVDRLALHVPPMSEGEAERLAVAVAEALRLWEPPAKAIDLARVTVDLEAERSPGGSPESLARQIAAAVMAAALREAGP